MRTVFVSDTHGFTDEFVHVMSDLGVCDSDGAWCAPADVALVHLGDWVDRGPDANPARRWRGGLDAWDLVRTWQQATSDRVIRLAGNHDIQYVGGKDLQCGRTLAPKDAARFRTELAADIRSGAVQFAHAHGEWLCTHGGLDPRWERHSSMSVAECAADLNRQGREWIEHPLQSRDLITAIDFMRGGYDPIPGVCWCDCTDNLCPVEDALSFGQIVGHRIQPEIRRSPGGKIWMIDVDYGTAQALVDDDGELWTTPQVHRYELAARQSEDADDATDAAA